MTFSIDTGRDCARAWEAMPWVLQDLAPQEQGEWLMQHIRDCEACRAEYAQQQRLRAALSLPAEVDLDPEVGLKRLLARVDAPAVPEAPARRDSAGWLTRALVAAVLLQALGLGAFGLKYWSGSEVSPYRTLSQQNQPVPAGAIHVVPDTAMKLAEWNSLLRKEHLQVVGGPNDVGAYTVLPANALATEQQTLQQLRATQGIRLAEPVATAP